MSDDDAAEIDFEDGDASDDADAGSAADGAASDDAVEDEAPSRDDGEATGREAGESAGREDDEAGDAEDVASDEDGAALAARVAAHDEALAREVAELEAELADAEAELAAKTEEVEDLTERLKRKQADFQNYKKRAKKRQEQLKERATEDLVERITTVRDNLVRALEQDEDADIRPGVESTLEEFDRILADENVAVIDPEPGEEVDPTRHQVMMRVDSDQPEGTVAEVYKPGYEMGDKVIREAQVTVSESDE